ncbi:uncharacterized membrane protein (DUF4010 family) [Balneicella halophila]|uniref:Uncharacterized membrane protein (DUF4010 family) n=1 Tax=Balneicella halophila TaxID=1537566 RepID=A0A7L4UMP4_BALHA|nr:DUF4010 domain-containing protein [Balneicella halophila]PVX49891.1 uncharacterized membrane protein (DUF4010 family) [Balneicella halophila]
MIDFLNNINPLLVNFILVVLFSLSLGMERRQQYETKSTKQTFGTDRTFTFIGVLGFLLLIADPSSKIPYLFGMGVLAVFMLVFYIFKAKKEEHYGMTSVLLAFITYGFPLFLSTASIWLSLLLFVVVLIMAGAKKPLRNVSKEIADDEFLTLAKFLIITGIILPILPKEDIHAYIPVSPYKIWLAVVVVSAISYLSYLLQKYVFPKAGLLLTAFLGGLYSSTASTIILARKSKNHDEHPKAYTGAIMITIAMMYLRVYILLMIFMPSIIRLTLPYFLALFIISLLVGIFYYRANHNNDKLETINTALEDENPLEFKVSIIFAGLYVLFSVITNLVLTNFGESGLSLLSIVVGVTDITPFLLNLFQGHYQVEHIMIAIATFQVMASNNVLKAVYAHIFSGEKTKRYIWKAFSIIIVANIIAVIVLYFL